ncbi:MAG: type II CRISPR RNA-guided endonuclease Cas9, partial [Candidatus Saccharimonadaceae bacterium]
MCNIENKKEKTILGLDLGTNSIGWALIKHNFENKEGSILGLNSRIIPMSQDVLNAFGDGQSYSQTANRTGFRGTRRLYQRDNLRRERLHRVLNILGFLPKHYAESIDFEKQLGQFKKETKLNYKVNDSGEHEFLFIESFNEMLQEFKVIQPKLFYKRGNGEETKIPLDWTLYYLRKKALTKKISKEELSWILLNFNQKRGYYQLRGEEEQDDDNKNNTFEVLKVDKLIDSGSRIKDSGDILYDVYFDNGWQYYKQITKSQDWINKTREFIVTTSTLKDGTTKRSFKAVDSEKDWIAIKEKTQQEIAQSGKEVGEYIYEILLQNPTQKIRGKLVRTIERKFYKNELKAILKKQIELHEELKDEALYAACIQELYSRNNAHRNSIQENGFEYLFLDDIIFYQRPLKSKKSTISNCQYEFTRYRKENIETGNLESIDKPLKAIPRSHPLFIEFRMWQFLRNLKIYHKLAKNDVDVTNQFIKNENDWCDLFDYLMNRKDVQQKQLLKHFIDSKAIDKNLQEEYRWNYPEDATYPMNDTKALFVSRLKKVKNFDLNKELTFDFQMRLWHIIYSVKDKNEFEQALKTFALKNNIDKDSFVENFKNHPPYKSEYAAYSEKAIKKLLPLMRVGRYWNKEDVSKEVVKRVNSIVERIQHLQVNEDNTQKEDKLKEAIRAVADDDVPAQFIKSFLSFKDKNPLAGLNTYQACYAVYERHSEASDIALWRSPKDIDNYLANFKQHSLRNPIVEQVLTETLRTVRDIWLHYGENDEKLFDEIHVELGRDMKNSADKRKSLSERNRENERTNQRIKELLQELKEAYPNQDIRPFSPSHQELLKIYEEGVFQNPNVSSAIFSEDDIKKIRNSNTLKKADITRYKLWLEQGYVSPYTGRVIPLSRLFSEDYQIEHIIPQSRYFDNSLGNKVICESEINPSPYKGNKTAYEFIKSMGGSVVQISNGRGTVEVLKLTAYENHCNNYFKRNRSKLRNLLSEEVPEGFIERQMNDSRYISKLVKGLLSNIVRSDDEKEATSKNLITMPGAITSKLKQDWGLNDKWNELISLRFQRLNEMTNSQDFGFWDNSINAFRTQVTDEIEKAGFNKKRIDHRHHAMDALVIACCTRNHAHYLSTLNAEGLNYGLRDKLLVKNDHGHYTKTFQLPWSTYPVDAKNSLEKAIISFKQNTRVINKTNNKTYQWVEKGNGVLKKELVKQVKGDNWAIRKALHKETVSGAVCIKRIKKGGSTLSYYLEKPELIVDKQIQGKVNYLNGAFLGDFSKIKKHLKEHPLKINGKIVNKIQVYEWTEGATATRTPLTDKFTRKQLESVTDSGIQRILDNHVNNYLDNSGKEQFEL